MSELILDPLNVAEWWFNKKKKSPSPSPQKRMESHLQEFSFSSRNSELLITAEGFKRLLTDALRALPSGSTFSSLQRSR